MDIIITALVTAAFVGVVCFVMLRRLKPSASVTLEDVSKLHDTIGQLQKDMQATVTERFDKSQELMRSNLQAQMSESAKLIRDVTERLTKLDETNRRVVDVTQELKTLQNVLTNPKQRGVYGEYFLKSVLENILPPNRFHIQYKFTDGEIVDAVIFLQKGLMLPIDSKFSLENYNRLVEEKEPAVRERLLAQLRLDLKTRIDETSKYIRPSEKTMDFAFMFIPSEALYYDLLVNKVAATTSGARDLLEYAFRDKRVIIVSPTSFMAYLQTVLQGLHSLQIEEQAKVIQKRVHELGRHLSQYETFMQKLGRSLETTVNQYNAAHKELGKIDKDVIKIAATEAAIEPLVLDKPVRDE